MNPFLSQQRLKVLEIKQKKHFKSTQHFEKEVSSMDNILTFNNSYFIEQDKKVNLYKVGFVRNVMTNLSPSTMKLFLYIVYTLKENCDFISLPLNKTLKNINISKPTYYKCIAELMEIELLCKKKREEYWVNPVYLFNGNKINFFKENCPDCIDIVHSVTKEF